MPQYLVVANQTLGGSPLVRRVEELAEAAAPDPIRVHLVVPVTRTDGTRQWEHPPIDRYLPEPEMLARTMAQARMQHELARLRRSGVDADGEVAAHDPVETVVSLVARQPYAAVLVSTLPSNLSRWLRVDLPSRLTRAVDVPVEHIEGSAGPSV